jgi:integrase/recombinase XerC
MRFSKAIDLWLAAMRGEGRINSDRTVANYRYSLECVAEVVDNRDPRLVARDDLRRTLARWENPNTKAMHLWAMRSFFDWLVEDGHGEGRDNGRRKDNPARQIRPPRKRPPKVYRLTSHEVQRIRLAATHWRERRIIDLGLLLGLRAAELRGVRGKHFRSPGWVWVSGDIAKGGSERWIPVPTELEPTWVDIARSTKDDEFAIPVVRNAWVGKDEWGDPVLRTNVDRSRPISYQSLWVLVRKVGKKAGIAADLHPHLLRHAYGAAVARQAQDIRVAQFVLGHRSVQTTQHYTQGVTRDEAARVLQSLGLSAPRSAANPVDITERTQLSEPLRGLPEPVSATFARLLAHLWTNEGIRDAARAIA